jgi:protein subunit release factor A
MSDLIDPSDLLVEACPPRHQGGQHAGSARGVKVTHIPSGLIAISEDCGSQHRNRSIAIAMIEGGLTSPQFTR